MSSEDPRDNILFELADLRESLKSFLRPEILLALTDLLEALGDDKTNFVTQYKFWVKKKGSDCRYASYAKQFFLDDHADNVAQCINWLYENWSCNYNKKD